MAWVVGVASAAALAAGIGAGTASATVILNSNFNGSFDSWTATTGTNATATDTGAESAFTNTAGGASLDLTDSSTTSAYGPYNVNEPFVTSPTLTGFTSADPLQVSFDFKAITTTNQENYDLAVNSASGADAFLTFYVASSASPSTAQGSNTTGLGTANGSISIGQWYHATLSLSPSGAQTTWGYNIVNTSDVSVASESGLGFRHPGQAYANLVAAFNNGYTASGGQFLIDNVLVATPEPTAISLLALSGVGLLILKPRRRARA